MFRKILTWLNANKVLLVGLAQFVYTSINEIFSNADAEYTPWIIAYSALIAICTYLGRNLRGQWASVFGSIIPTLYVIDSLHTTHTPITFEIITIKILFPLGGALMAIFWSTPPKSRAYENQPAVMEAKVQAQIEAPNPLAKAEIKEEVKQISNENK